MELATEGLIWGTNSGPFDPEINVLTTRSRIHSLNNPP